MSQAKHTPGPRTVLNFDDAQIVVLGPKDSDGRQELVGTFTGDNARGNATIDAAAPDLLAACEAIIRYYESGGREPFQEAANLAREAIAKAAP